jgi:hemoglobin/transferrin/lactoferrin receptor protein
MKKTTWVALLCVGFLKTQGQKTDSITTFKMQGVEITETPLEKNSLLKAQHKFQFSKNQINSQQAPSTADLLASRPEIFIQKSQQGGGSITLRGFEASRVLMYVDGVRMNNLIYRSGHLQNVITIDNQSLESVQVLMGASSTVYGSDALGGVIHFYTIKPSFYSPKWGSNGSASVRYGSVNREYTQHADAQYGNDRWGFATSITTSNFSDLRSGKNPNPFHTENYGLRPFYVQRINNKDSLVVNPDPYIQKYSGYNQTDFIQKIAFKPNKNDIHQLNVQISTSSNIPRYDRLTDPLGNGLKYAAWYYGPQERNMIAYDFIRKKETLYFQTKQAGIHVQKIQESRYTRKFNSNNLDERMENVQVYGGKFQAQHQGKKAIWVIGSDVQLNLLQSTAQRNNLATQVISGLDTRYPNGKNEMIQGGIFQDHILKISEHWVMNDGVRLGYSTLQSSIKDTTYFKFPFTQIQQNNPLYSMQWGMNYFSRGVHESDQLKLSFLSSTGFRVPNIDDLSKIFETGAGNVILPNNHLKPEKTWTNELGMTKSWNDDHLTWENHVYYTRFYDAITTLPFTYLGKDSLVYDGINSPIFANQNVGKAFIYGIQSSISYSKNNITLNGGFQYTYGRMIKDDVRSPLDHIPPIMGQVRLMYRWNNLLTSMIQVQFQGKKKISDYLLNGEDNEQYAPADGMPAWIVAHMRFTYVLPKNFSINTGIENIFNTQYRIFASGINAPGRNIYISLKYQW